MNNYILKVKYNKGYFDDENIDLNQELTYSSIRDVTIEEVQEVYRNCKVLSIKKV